MSRWHAYLKSAKEIVETYDGELPLSHWIKDYFRGHKKMGSSDRRMLSSLAYQYYRTCKAFHELPVEEHLLAARFLCSQEPDQFLQQLRPEWNDDLSLPVPEKEAALTKYYSGNISFEYFPFGKLLSNGIDYTQFSYSFLQQPDVFLRVRPGKLKQVVSKLNRAGISYQEMGQLCLSIPSQSKIEEILDLNAEAVVQDYSSQRVGAFLGLSDQHLPVKVWDCCSASGGKSIMAFDLSHNIDLTVSDVRQSILENLKRRFWEAGIRFYQAFQADLTGQIHLANESFDLIIADLPCSGSGTWSRTPEQLCFFQEGRIDYYSSLQKAILTKVAPKLKTGGRLVYITCSVFKAENEDIVDYASVEIGLQVREIELLKGYDKRADSMFVSVLEKS